MGVCISYSRRSTTIHHTTYEVSPPFNVSAKPRGTHYDRYFNPKASNKHENENGNGHGELDLDLTMTVSQIESSTAVAVYCASSMGKEVAYQNAAASLGTALGHASRPLVYGGGSKGLMGIVSGAVLKTGGTVTGVVPYAMVAAGGEKSAAPTSADGVPGYGKVVLEEKGRETVQTIIVNSMHERKMEMAKRSCAFFGLPGGFGTFEEVLEVATWSQLGIHNKPIILINVLSYWDPLRSLIRAGVSAGFISPKNEALIQFVDGPADHALHADFDWGKAGVEALERWQVVVSSYQVYDWGKRREGRGEEIEAI